MALVKLGEYELTAEIGRGGMGTVFRGRGPDGAVVAVKLMHNPNARSALARFDRERRLMTALDEKKGFVPLLDAGESPSGPYLVMPLVTGGTLRERLRRGPLPVAEVVGLAETLARSLAEAHALGIVHRDLKPENMIFTADGRPLIADLGLAKHFAFDAPGSSQSVAITKSGQVVGTMGYSPIEQMRDAGDATPASDVFSLGVVLYECLTGERPFRAENVVDLLGAVEAGTFTPVLRHRPDVPPALAALVERALSREMEKRPADASAFLAALAATRAAGERSTSRMAVAALSLLVALGGGALILRGALSVKAPLPSPVTPPPVSPPPAATTSATAVPAKTAARKLREGAEAKALAGDEKGAITDLTRAIELDPRDATAWRLRGSLRVNAHDPRGAIDDLDRALELAPEDAQAWCNRAAAWLNGSERVQGDRRAALESARSDAERAVKLSPRYAKGWSTLATALDRSGELDRAIEAYGRALELDASNVEAWHGRGLAREKRGDVSGAIDDLRRAVTVDARSATLWFNLGVTLRNNGRAREALDALGRAIELAPEDALAWRNRGAANLQVNEARAGVADLDQAVRLAPRDAEAWHLRGLCKGQTGDLEGGIADVSHAIDLNPRAGSMFMNRGVLREKNGDHPGALADMRRFVELCPDDPKAAGIRKTIEANDRRARGE